MPRRRFDHAHRLGTAPSTALPPTGVPSAARPSSFAPPRPIGELRIGRRRRGRRAARALVGVLGIVAALAVTTSAWPRGTSPAAGRQSAGPGSTAGPAGVAVAGLPRHDEPRPSAGPTPPEALTGYGWPIDNARITNGFGKGQYGDFVVDGERVHDGIDLATFCGDRIVAAHDGVVLGAGRHLEGLMGWIGDLGPYRARLDAENAWRTQAISVVIDDGNGYQSAYVHLSRTAVEAGQTVRAGDLIGYEGATGKATGCHLHYEIYSPLERRTFALDPKVAAKSRLPGFEIARINPLRVLPPMDEAGITWGWGVRQS